MTVPIADDWQAIRDRMREIEAERSGKRRCPACKGAGWVLDFFGVRSRIYIVCVVCHNPDKCPRSLHGEDKAVGRTSYYLRP